MAANGYNMVMVYAFEKVAAGHVPTPEELQAFLTHCETAGIKVIFNFMSWWEQYSYCAAAQTKGCDLTQITSDFDEMVKVGARSKSLLGWYMCDDCCSLSDDQVRLPPNQAARPIPPDHRRCERWVCSSFLRRGWQPNPG
jgi:hypothetical protein